MNTGTRPWKSKMHESKIHCGEPESTSLVCYQTFRCTAAEAVQLAADAKNLHMTMSALARSRILQRRDPPLPPPTINLATYTENGHLSSNLNQLVRHMNEQRLAGIQVVIQHAELKALVEKLININGQIRADLIGSGSK